MNWWHCSTIICFTPSSNIKASMLINRQTTGSGWLLTNTPSNHLHSVEWNQSFCFQLLRTASSLFCHHHLHPHHHLDGHCCLHFLNSYSSHWSHHDICSLSEFIARIHPGCWVKVGDSYSFICFPSLSRFEELSSIHLELQEFILVVGSRLAILTPSFAFLL